MKIILSLLLVIFFSCLHARELGETEITTEDGIEVYQKEKYYLLKKNVQIVSDNFTLNAKNVKAYFNKDLYDITDIYSQGNVILESSDGLQVLGDIVDYNIINEKIIIKGENSFLKNNEFTMSSDEYIELNNKSGEFELRGMNSKLNTEKIKITGENIKGRYQNINGENIMEKLYVDDPILSNIKTINMDMYALKAEYDKNTNIIKLFEKVKIIRNDETITGDHAIINTLDESYKITSKDSKRVKVLLKKTDE